MVAMHSDFKIFGLFKMSPLKWRALVFVIGSVAAMTTDNYACPKYCVCNGNVMKCDGVIPEDIPEPIKEVELVDLDQDVLFYEVFCQSNWASLTKLSIVCQHKCAEEFHTIGENVFRCLDSLESLSIHLDVLEYIGNYTLTGLPNLSILDLSRCYMLSSLAVAALISDESGLSNISEINLSKTGLYCRPNNLELNEAIIDQLGKRRVSLVTLSSSRVVVKEFGMASFDRFCSSIVTLNAFNSVVVRSHLILHQTPCSSLRILDISGITPTRIKNLALNNTQFVFGENAYPILLQRLSTLYLNHIVSTENVIYLRNVSLTLTSHNYLKEFYMCDYNAPVFGVQILLIYNHIERIVLSNNRIETLGYNIFKNFTRLRQIDISQNRLGRSESLSTTFSNLFRANTLTTDVLMAGNGIPFLPNDTFFSNTMLERIDLSENSFQQITFEITHLRHLKVLDMQKNSIESLNTFSRISLDKLYNHQNKETSETDNHSLLADLRGNPFSCSCQSLDFLKWFVSSPVFKYTRHQYSCKIDGQTIPMNVAAVSAAQDECEKPIRRKRKLVLLSVLPTIAAFAVLFGILWIIKKRRERLRQRRLEDRIKLIQDGDIEEKFLVFLSFSSDDERFVAANILQPLKDHLKILLDTERDLICLGDRYFCLGRTNYSEMTRRLDDCAVFIAVMSRNYCNSEYCKLEIEEARVKGMSIIPIFIEDVEESEMSRVTREVFRNYTRTKFVLKEGIYKLNLDWENVCESIIQLVEIK